MQIKNSAYISYNRVPAKEAWLNGTLVWAFSGYGWVQKNLATSSWTDITYGPIDTLVATGLNFWSYSFNNGTTWGSLSTLNPDVGNEFHNAIAYGNNKWSIIESINNPWASKNSYTSTNILTGWTKSDFLGTTLNPIFSSFGYTDMIFNPNNNKFLTILDQRSQTSLVTNAVVVYSDDGISWLSGGYFAQNGTPITEPQGFAHCTVGTNMPNNRLAACGSSGAHKFGYSDNGGLSWIQGNYNPGASGQNLQTGHNWTQVAYGYDSNVNLPLSGRCVAVCNSGSTSTYQFAYSNDGIGWYGVSYASSSLKRNWNSVVYGNGYFIALSDSYQALSKDGINWTAFANVPSTVGISDVTAANNRFIGIKNNQAGGNNVVVADFFAI